MLFNHARLLSAVAMATVLAACGEEPTTPERRFDKKPHLSDGGTCDPMTAIVPCDGGPSSGGATLTEQQSIDTAYYNHVVYDPFPHIDWLTFLDYPESISDQWFEQNAPAYTTAQEQQINSDADEVSSYTGQFGFPTASTEPAQSRFLYAALSSPHRGVMRPRGRARAMLARRDCEAESVPGATAFAASYAAASFQTDASCERQFNRCVQRCNRMNWRAMVVCRGACLIGYYYCKHRRNGRRPSGG
jgi:hypothetical protein